MRLGCTCSKKSSTLNQTVKSIRQGGSASPRTMLSKRRKPIPFGKVVENSHVALSRGIGRPHKDGSAQGALVLTTRLEIAFHLALLTVTVSTHTKRLTTWINACHPEPPSLCASRNRFRVRSRVYSK